MLQEATNFSLSQEPSNKSINKALKSIPGCQVHTHLLNEFFEPQSDKGNSLYFVEFFELSGHVLEHETMMQCFAYNRNFSSLVVCVDLSNTKTINKLASTIQKGIRAVLQS